jgi:hypothetical protein
MVTNVTSLLKTVKAVEDEHTRGTRALESTIEAIAQEIRVSKLFSYRTKRWLSFHLLAIRSVRLIRKTSKNSLPMSQEIWCRKVIAVYCVTHMTQINSARREQNGGYLNIRT